MFARVAVTKCHSLGGLNSRNSQFWGLDVQDHGVSRVRFLGGLSPGPAGSCQALCLSSASSHPWHLLPAGTQSDWIRVTLMGLGS